MLFGKKDNDKEPEYMGNIWGWKLSYLSLVLIDIMLGLMSARHCYLEKHPEERVKIEENR